VLEGQTSAISWTKIYGGKVTENLIQALARIVVAEQMAKIGQHYHVAFQVHDEIIITAPAEEATHAQQLLEGIMSTPPVWCPDLPVACESGVATTYGDT
jgi:DNA polymerase